MSEPQHRSIVVTDIENSGSLSGPDKEKVRRDLYATLDAALLRSAIAPDEVRHEDRGDGVFLLIDAAVSKRRLFDPFLLAIDESLGRRRVDDVPLRLRMVVHHGEVILDPHGSSGPALDQAFAVLDAEELKTALADTREGRMAVAVPDDLYRSVVDGHPAPDPDAFRMRHLTTKRGTCKVWVTVTGARQQPGSGPWEPVTTPRVGTPAATMTNQPGGTWVDTNYGFAGSNNGGNVTFDQRGQGRGEI